MAPHDRAGQGQTPRERPRSRGPARGQFGPRDRADPVDRLGERPRLRSRRAGQPPRCRRARPHRPDRAGDRRGADHRVRAGRPLPLRPRPHPAHPLPGPRGHPAPEGAPTCGRGPRGGWRRRPRSPGGASRHWLAATHPTDVSKALHYARRAGEATLAAFAPLDAVSWFSEALELVGGRRAPDGRELCRLLVDLGTAQHQAGMPGQHTTLLDAAAMAQRLGDAELLVAAALGSRRGLDVAAEADSERIAVLEAALAAMGDSDPGLAGAAARLPRRGRRHPGLAPPFGTSATPPWPSPNASRTRP